MLGVFTANIPFGPSGPRTCTPSPGSCACTTSPTCNPRSATAAAEREPSAVPPACEFVDALLVLDATTGAVIVYSY